MTNKEACIKSWEIIADFHREEIQNARNMKHSYLRWIEETHEGLDTESYKRAAVGELDEKFGLDESIIPKLGTNYCFACLHTKQKSYKVFGCELTCPIIWGLNDLGIPTRNCSCCDVNSPYLNWSESETPEEALSHAVRMIELTKTWED